MSDKAFNRSRYGCKGCGKGRSYLKANKLLSFHLICITISKGTGVLNVSVLSEKADFVIFKHFGFQSGRDVNKFADSGMVVVYKIADNGVPYIAADTNAYFSLKVKEMVDCGSHTLFITEPTDMVVLNDEPSCTYSYYQENIKPKHNAAVDTDKVELLQGQHVYRCKICGYEYVGETLPEDFICPTCKHGAEDFDIVR